MKAVKFDEANAELATDQPQYQPLPVHINREQPEVPMTACFKLSAEEIAEINETGLLWSTQWTFGNAFHPISMSTKNPFL